MAIGLGAGSVGIIGAGVGIGAAAGAAPAQAAYNNSYNHGYPRNYASDAAATIMSGSITGGSIIGIIIATILGISATAGTIIAGLKLDRDAIAKEILATKRNTQENLKEEYIVTDEEIDSYITAYILEEALK